MSYMHRPLVFDMNHTFTYLSDLRMLDVGRWWESTNKPHQPIGLSANMFGIRRQRMMCLDCGLGRLFTEVAFKPSDFRQGTLSCRWN